MTDLTLARMRANLTREQAAALVGRAMRTWRRWESEGAPAWVFHILEMAAGQLGHLKDWAGWYVADGLLYHPQIRTGFSPGEVASLWFRRQQVRSLQVENRQLRARLALFSPANEDLAWSRFE